MESSSSSFEASYDRIKLLGEGAFGAAYLIRSKQSRKAYYVAKEVKVSHLSPEQRKTAIGEAETLRKLQHPNIIAYEASFEEGPRMYIVMEYADGGDLAEKIKAKRDEGASNFSERSVMFVFIQMGLALEHVHSRKILHRDIKPLNVFLTRQGNVKLGDFGIATYLDSTHAGAKTTIGTPFYLSPEMVNSERYGVKSDIWALGVVAYEMAALRVPFHAHALPAVAMKICNADPDPLPDVYPKAFVDIVFSLLEKEPKDRPKLKHLLYGDNQYIKRWVQENLAHTRATGTGGCEDMVIRRSTPSPPPQPDAADRRRAPDRERSGRGHDRQPQPRNVEKLPNGSRHDSDELPAAGGGGAVRREHRPPRRDHPREAHRQHRVAADDPEVRRRRLEAEQQAIMERQRKALLQDFLERQEMALANKRRAESERCAASREQQDSIGDDSETMAYAGGSHGFTRSSPRGGRMHHDDNEDHRMTVKKRAREEQLRQDEMRQRELIDAIRQNEQHRLEVAARIRARNGEAEMPETGGAGEEAGGTKRIDAEGNPTDCTQTLTAAAPARADTPEADGAMAETLGAKDEQMRILALARCDSNDFEDSNMQMTTVGGNNEPSTANGDAHQKPARQSGRSADQQGCASDDMTATIAEPEGLKDGSGKMVLDFSSSFKASFKTAKRLAPKREGRPERPRETLVGGAAVGADATLRANGTVRVDAKTAKLAPLSPPGGRSSKVEDEEDERSPGHATRKDIGSATVAPKDESAYLKDGCMVFDFSDQFKKTKKKPVLSSDRRKANDSNEETVRFESTIRQEADVLQSAVDSQAPAVPSKPPRMPPTEGAAGTPVRWLRSQTVAGLSTDTAELGSTLGGFDGEGSAVYNDTSSTLSFSLTPAPTPNGGGMNALESALLGAFEGRSRRSGKGEDLVARRKAATDERCDTPPSMVHTNCSVRTDLDLSSDSDDDWG